MKALIKSLKFVLLGVVCVIAQIANAAEIGRAESYIGSQIYIDSEEYKNMSSSAGYQGHVIHDDEYLPLKVGYPRRSLILEVFHNENFSNSFFLIAEDHLDPNGHPDWMFVHDAKDIPMDMKFIGADQDRCIAKKYPTDHVFVIGKWVNRKTKDGDYAGGYAYPIHKAWRVDFSAKKLVEIPTRSIRCENITQPGEIN